MEFYINREICFQHYSDANSLATEAITNVRTVRGVSSEPYEVDRYEVAMADALRKGVKDAIFGRSRRPLTTTSIWALGCCCSGTAARSR